MTQAAHTPTPWAVEDPMGADFGLWLVQDGLKPFQWSCVAMVMRDDEDIRRHPDTRFITKDEQEANAAFIVRAVNSHDDLVAALETMVNNWGNQHHKDLAQARAALAKAGA